MPKLSRPDPLSKDNKHLLMLRFLKMQEVLVGAGFSEMFLPVLPVTCLLSVVHSRIANRPPRSELMMFKMILVGRAALVQVTP